MDDLQLTSTTACMKRQQQHLIALPSHGFSQSALSSECLKNTGGAGIRGTVCSRLQLGVCVCVSVCVCLCVFVCMCVFMYATKNFYVSSCQPEPCEWGMHKLSSRDTSKHSHS